jgi:phosphoribosyl-AMP cyclohydrolase
MTINFKKSGGLVPVIIQNTHTLQVLMLGYMNEEALEKTKAEGRVTFFSRSQNRLWTKGLLSDLLYFLYSTFSQSIFRDFTSITNGSE